jgi:hypothetical protein
LDNEQLFHDVMRELLGQYQTDVEAAEHILNDLWVLGYRGVAHELLQRFGADASEAGAHLRKKLMYRWGTEGLSEAEVRELTQNQPSPS